jgi:uncharacterized membrane protein YfcA
MLKKFDVIPHLAWKFGRYRKFTTKTPNKENDSSSTSSSLVDKFHTFSIGTFAGLLGSLCGMGGGFVMIPMMTAAAVRTTSSTSTSTVVSSWWRVGGLGLNQHQAHGTSLFAVGTTGFAGALGYGIRMSSNAAADDDENDIGESLVGMVDEGSNVSGTALDVAKELTANNNKNIDQEQTTRGKVELDAAMALAITAALTARYGAIISSKLSERVLQRALGAYMIGIAPLVPAKAYFESLDNSSHDAATTITSNTRITTELDTQHGLEEQGIGKVYISQLERLLPISLVGIFSGFLSGMFGVGGGTVVVPALVLSTDMSYHSALGTSLCAMVLPAMVGTYTNSKLGNVNWRIAPFLAVGSFVGAFVGAREVGSNIDDGVLRVGFSCLMFVLGLKTWRKGSR